jgi:adenylate cyclase, class 2
MGCCEVLTTNIIHYIYILSKISAVANFISIRMDLFCYTEFMKVEYEATFIEIDIEAVRNNLSSVGANLVKQEFLQKRTVFHLPAGNNIKGGWARVRDEGDKITMSIKVVDGNKIENQKESCLTVDNYKEAELFLLTIGCQKKSYQETRRELWVLDGAEVTIDTWPFLEPFVEVESNSEEVVKSVSEKIGMNWSLAKFCAVDVLYTEKYGITADQINNRTPEIIFEMKNPFVKLF